jgi:hypothetical protein
MLPWCSTSCARLCARSRRRAPLAAGGRSAGGRRHRGGIAAADQARRRLPAAHLSGLLGGVLEEAPLAISTVHLLCAEVLHGCAGRSTALLGPFRPGQSARLTRSWSRSPRSSGSRRPPRRASSPRWTRRPTPTSSRSRTVPTGCGCPPVRLGINPIVTLEKQPLIMIGNLV